MEVQTKRATDIFPGLKPVLALANSSGSIVESYVYDAYGNVTIRNGSGTVIPSSAYGNRFLFQGREYDYTTQLYNFRARWYDPETGRWLSNDPIGISGGLNLYAFCGNDPVNYVDPMGFYSKYSNAALLAEEGCGFGTFTDPDTGEEIGGAQVLGMMVGGVANGMAMVAGGGVGRAVAAGVAAMVVDGLVDNATNASGSEVSCPNDSGYIVGAGSLRNNMISAGGEPPPGYHAHHTFPKAFRKQFERIGLNIDSASHGVWINAKEHLAKSAKYNKAWGAVIDNINIKNVFEYRNSFMKNIFNIIMK